MSPECANYFHDWVSVGFSFNHDLTIELEIAMDADLIHKAVLVFKSYDGLLIQTFEDNLISEERNLEYIEKVALDRWLQKVLLKEGKTEVVFLGSNDFSDSHWVALHFTCKNIEIQINNRIATNEEDLKNYLNGLHIFE